MHFAGEDLEMHILERMHAAKRFRDMLDLEKRCVIAHRQTPQQIIQDTAGRMFRG